VRRIASALPAFVLAACFAGGPGLPDRGDAGPTPIDLSGGDGGGKLDVDLGDPFALTAVQPTHGPFTGGTRAVLFGRGFPSKLRVFVGGVELDPSSVLASDPSRASVTMPAGKPGPVDVVVRDDATARERKLPGGYTFDAFVVEPSSGATTGGTRVHVRGKGTNFAKGTTVDFGGKACAAVAVLSPEELECETPPQPAGARDVTVTTPSETIQVRDAFTYADSPDGYRGGLSGAALAGTLTVLALDAWTGIPIAGAKAIVGAASPLVATTNQAGAAVLTDGKLVGGVTVTVAEKCHQPITFVDVPVDRVTVYLDPILDLSCASGDPPSTTGKGKDVGVIEGQLVFPLAGEAQTRSDWSGVPQPVRSTERRAAYVLVASPYWNDVFRQPDPSAAVTMASPGTAGWGFAVAANPGNVTIYALAGIEDRANDAAPPKFTPYVMGIARGVPVLPKTTTTNVDVAMNMLLGHDVRVEPQVGPAGPSGPDRVSGRIALTLGPGAYAHLPTGAPSGYLPNPGTLAFVGVPALDGPLTGEAYLLGLSAVTGFDQRPPASIVSRLKTTNANTPLVVSGFVPAPTPVEPGAGVWAGTHVTVDTKGATFDLLEIVVSSGGGLVQWVIASPNRADFDLPDLASIDPKLGIRSGAIRTTAYLARADGFLYSSMRQGFLSSSNWSAWGYDVVMGQH
jgi:hypothetical protein